MTTIHPAAENDAPLILRYIQELAEYENLSDKVFVTEMVLRDWISSGKVEVLLAKYNGEDAGFVLYYFTYATFRGNTGIYIEDLFVRPEYRRNGIGKMLFREVARIAKKRGCFRIDWMVLDWNNSGAAFYKTIGGIPVNDWITYRLQDQSIDLLADDKTEP
ncbi:MAG: GNAT family N-acetyltransferase [Planctomycetaceae bacterium]|jgi:GNAT superfamily N-acetyltransferase|nr:GNAT family N-acetyltransferase [Planctomycetaceae bacterium]